jgi:hypothetical protein
VRYPVAAILTAALLFAVLSESPRSAAAQVEPPAPPPPQARNRFEIRPIVGWGSSPSTLSHWFVGGGVYVHAPRVAAGVDVVAFTPFNGEHSSTPSYPLNESAWSATVSAAFLPFRTHVLEEGSSRIIVPYILGGVGAISTRPVAVVDPANRVFDYKPTVLFAAALGIHVLLSSSVGLDFELRDTLYYAQLESPTIANGPVGAPSVPTSPANPATWYGQSSPTNFIALHVGVSFFTGGG